MAYPNKAVPFGQYLVNEVLPEELRDYNRILTKKEQNKVLSLLAEKYPEKYKDAVYEWSKIGGKVSSQSGGFSPSVKHLLTAESAKKIRNEFNQVKNKILKNPNLTPEQKNESIIEAAFNASEKQREEVFNEALAKKNPFALQAYTGARGNPGNVNSLIGSDYLYMDSKNNPIPFAITHSYGEGLRPTEYWAAAYGARKGVIDPKMATRNSGFLCLAENTEVRMADFSTKLIKDIKVGDWVLGVDTATMEGRPVQVTAVFDNGLKECWRTKFSVGTEKGTEIYLDSTLDHKVYGEIRYSKCVYRENEDGIKYQTNEVLYDLTTHPIGKPGFFAAATLNPVSDYEGVAESLLSQFTNEQKRDKRKYYRQSQVLLGERQTYDIEVNSENHLFVLANGLIVSNSKQLVAMANRGIISKLDADTADENRGFPTSVDDDDNIGALLARSVGGYRRNTKITGKILSDLRKQGISDILVRSPAVGGAEDGSLYAYDVGYREKGRLPVIGENPSITAVQALSEPIGQGALCLAIDTQVRMFDGTLKKIQDIKVGDVVLGSDLDGRCFPNKVTNTFINGVKPCYKFKYSLYKLGYTISVCCTADHKFLKASGTVDNYMPKAVPSMTLRDLIAFKLPGAETGNAVFTSYSVRATESLPQETFDIEVEHKDHLFILGNGLVCSNSCLEAGTLVRMADLSVKKIENIEIGDVVCGVDEQGEMVTANVTNTFNNGKRKCFKYIFSDAHSSTTVSVNCTPEHKFKARIPALYDEYIVDKLPIGMDCPVFEAISILNEDLDVALDLDIPVYKFYRTDAIPRGFCDTYDIEVDIDSHLFVLANGLICSNSKHLGGVASRSGNAVSGFKAINQLLQVPKVYTGGAAHSEVDGYVQSIEDAPQGGKYITISGKQHYVLPGFEPKVKVHQDVEAGDILSDGLPNPSLVVKHKGIGEGRRYFIETFKNAMSEAGLSANRRNIELLSRGAVNHVRLTSEYEDYLPDDVLPYNLIEARYKPREDSKELHVGAAKGKYLESPVLHYSIGTRIQPSVVNTLKKYGVSNVRVHDAPPPFEPEMIRGVANISYDPDFFTSMGGSGIKRRFLKAVHRGESSNMKGTSYIPGVAFDPNFGAASNPVSAPIHILKDPKKLSDFL